jgi:hypothetical protein
VPFGAFEYCADKALEMLMRYWKRGVSSLTIPEIADGAALEQDEEEVKYREGSDGRHSYVDDYPVEAPESYPNEEYGDGETDEGRRQGVEDPM